MSIDMPKLIAAVAKNAEAMGAESAAVAVLRRMPPEMVLRVAARLLRDAYLRVSDICGDGDIVKLPLAPEHRKSRRRSASPSAKQRAQVARTDEDIDKRLWQSINRAIDIFKTELRAEWTAEILEQVFTRPDGTEVTWADATADDHVAAAQQARLTADSALLIVAMHEKAATDLRAAGAATLAELTAAAAA